MNNLSSYCGLVDAKIRASDKDLPVKQIFNLHSVAKVYAVLPFYDVKCLCSGGRE